MKDFKKTCRIITAWTLSLSMVLGCGTFGVLADELQDGDAAAQVETVVVPDEEIPEAAPAVEAETEVTAEIPDDSAPVEEILFGDGGEVVAPEDVVPEEPEFLSDGEEGGEENGEENNGEENGEENPPEEEGPHISFGDQFSQDDWSRIFPDTTLTLYLEGISEGDTIEWQIKGYNYPDDYSAAVPVEASSLIEVVSSDNEKYVLKGLSSDLYNPNVIVSALVRNADGWLYSTPTVRIYVQKPVANYNYDDVEYNRHMLVGQNRNIGSVVYYDVCDPEHREWLYTEIPYTNVEVAQFTYGENNEEVPVESGVVDITRNDDGWWWIQGVGIGHAVITITSPSTEDPNSEPKTESFDFYVDGDTYNLDIIYPNVDSNQMLPGSTMELNTTLTHSWYHSNEDRSEEEITNYRLEPILPDYKLPFEVTTEGTKIILKAGKYEGYGDFDVKAVVLDGNGNPTGAETTQFVDAGVQGVYSIINISEEETEALRTLDLGATTEINPTVTQITGEEEVELDPAEYSFHIEGWDTNALEITDGTGKVLTADDTTGTAPFKIRKIGNWWTNFRLVAEQYDEESGEFIYLGQRWPFTDEQDYYSWLETADERYSGDINTWMYDDEDVTLTLNMENLQGVDVETKWEVGDFDDNGNLTKEAAAECYKVDSTNNTITLYGDKLINYYGPEAEYGDIGIKVLINVNGIYTDNDAWMWVNVRPTYYEYGWTSQEPGDRNIFPGQDLNIPATIRTYAEDGDHPYSENGEVKVTDVKIIQNIVWDDEAGEDVETDENLVEVTQNEDGSWNIHAGEQIGTTYLDLITESIKPDEESTSYYKETDSYFDVNIVGENYYLDFQFTDERQSMVFPGDSMMITSSLHHTYFDDEGEWHDEPIEDYKLSVTNDDGTPTYNTDWVEAEIVDNTSIKVTGKETESDWWDLLYVRACIPQEDGQDREVGAARIQLCVTPVFNQILPVDLLTPEGRTFNVDKNQELDLNTFDLQIKHFEQNSENNESILSGDNYRIRLREEGYGYNPDVWTIKPGTESQLIPVLVRNGEAAQDNADVYLDGEERQLDDKGNPETDENGEEIWNVIASCVFPLSSLCDEHTWETFTVDATTESPKIVIKHCTVCNVETRETVGEKLLAEPVLGKATSAGYNKIKVTWTAVEGADGYKVLRKGPQDTEWTTVGTVKAPATSFVDKPVTFGETYTYTVSAYRGEGETLEGSKYNETGITGKTILGKVVLKKATGTGTAIKVTWKKKAGANGYIVLRKTADGAWKRVGTVSAKATSFTDKKVDAGKEYTYTVRAYRKVNKKNVKGRIDKKGVTATTATK